MLLAAVLVGGLAAATGVPGAEKADPPGLTPIDAAPPPPPRIISGEVMEPDVTIRQTGEGTVTEYRVGGRLVAVKVQPGSAPAYYLVDSDGDGTLENQRHPLEGEFLINSWVIFRW